MNVSDQDSVKKQRFSTFGKYVTILGYGTIVFALLFVLGTLGVLKNGFYQQGAVVCDTASCVQTLSGTTTPAGTIPGTIPPTGVAPIPTTPNTPVATTSNTGTTPATTTLPGTASNFPTPITPVSTTTDVRVPIVEFINIPTTPVLDTDIKVSLLIRNANSPRLEFVAPAQNYQAVIEGSASSSAGYYTYLLPTKTVPSGEYYLKVLVLSDTTQTMTTFSSRRFAVAHQTIATTTATTTKVVPITATTTATTTKVVPNIATTTATTTKVVPLPIDTKVLVPPVATTTASTTAIAYNATIIVEPAAQDSKVLRVFVKTDNVFDLVDLYIRNTASVQRTFLGVATKVPNGYIYWFDTSKVPAGTYLLIMQGRLGDKIIYTATTDKIDVSTAVVPVAPPTKEVTEITTVLTKPAADPTAIDYLALRKEAATLPDLLTRIAAPAATTTTPGQAPVEPENPVEVARVNDLMQERSTELNELLQKRASALQVDDVTTKRLAEEALNKEIKALAADSGTSKEDAALIERLVTQEIERVTQNIEKTENLIKARTNNRISRDTDLDGISDYDEVTIYKTNPKEVDSDADGVIDGIEIMRGFDPVNAVAEAVIDYSSPKDFGYINEEVLKVEKVQPIVDYGEESTVATVKSEIRGFGLPNSFVTLYIYSTPTVVTVKTNTDGSFAYVFDKELEDGAHEVYVALTDNTGDIVVKSNAFSFVKTAQAFTYEDSLESKVAVTEAPLLPTDVSKTVVLTIAMSVVALGFVLVLLGNVLRTRRQDHIVA